MKRNNKISQRAADELLYYAAEMTVILLSQGYHDHLETRDADVAGRVYSGIVGPFCSVQCRDGWAALEDM